MANIKAEERERDHLTVQEVNRLIDIASAGGKYKTGLRDGLLLGMLYRHGLRISEAINFKWQDVEFDQNRIYIRRAKGSISSYHPLLELKTPITERYLLMELRQQQNNQTNPYIFTTRQSTSVSVSYVRKMLKSYAVKAGIPFEPWLHILRHSCGTHMALNKLPVLEIQTWLGHADIRNTMKYIHKANNLAETSKRWW